MRQLTLTRAGLVEWSETVEPVLLTAHDALVRPLVASTCDFDHLLVGGRVPLPLPVPLGHEAVGEVVAVGDEVTSVRPGDLVVIPFQVACGACRQCRAGRSSACEAVSWLSCFGLGSAAGGYGGLVADLARVPYADAMLVTLPPDVDPVSAASLSCNLVDAYRCVVPHVADRPDARVLVLGGAFANIALFAALLAREAGAPGVLLVTADPTLAVRAARLGVPVVDRLEPEHGTFGITADAAMDADLLHRAAMATEPGGVLTVSTMYVDGASLPLMPLFERGLTVVTGQPHARGLLPPALDLLASGLPAGQVTDEVLDWEDAPAAFTRGAGKRVVVRP